MKRIKKVLLVGLILTCFCYLINGTAITAFAAGTSKTIEGSVYEFDEKSDYEYSSSEVYASTSGANTYGTFKISGNISNEGKKDNIIAYGINGGSVDFTYSYTDALLNAAADQWHLVEDNGKKIDSLKLDSKIGFGAIILQSSKDCKTWVTDKTITNVFSETPAQSSSFYTTKELQMTNGTFFRLIVVYETGIKTGEKKIGPIKTEQFDYKKNTEIYEFYLYDINSDARSGEVTMTKNLGSVVNTGKDNGYSGSDALTIKDPHYGWTLGQFFVSGYTRETVDPNNSQIPVFLKNVGDEVTLWFNLKQDINQLNGDSKLSINDDSNGYDQYFQTGKTDMGRGTLIIRYTDHQGIAHEPEIYTNYLEANATTSADTIVKFFEEGDYEVALDYEIKNTPRQVVGVEIVPEYTNYRIYFRFSIRNGNCMVYPFDVSTGTELTDEEITPNGFKLDMAKSRYLTIDVQRSVVTEGANGYVEDVRFNRPAKDGDQYVDEGIYTFSVKNLYTGENTTKTIYVGNTGYMRALSVNKISVTELNVQVSQGATIGNDGKLTMPEPTTELESTTEPEPTTTEETSEPESKPEPTAEASSEASEATEPKNESTGTQSTEENIEEGTTEKKSSPAVPVVIGLVAAAGIGGVTMSKRKKKGE